MKLEVLANELLLELFEYLNAVHLFHGFYGLNSRFQNLISTHCQTFKINFREIPINKLDEFCQQYLPLIIDRIKSLHLFNNIETLNLLKIVLTSNFSPDQFIHLQSLSLYEIHFIDKITHIIDRCPDLKHFVLIQCYIAQENDINLSIFFNKIWSLSKLIYCRFQELTKPNDRVLNIILKVISISIKYLYFYNSCTMFHPFDLLSYTPNLERLCLDTLLRDFYRELETNFSSISILKMKFTSSIYEYVDFLQYMPNLYHLKIEMSNDKMDGHVWESVISNYLPKLKIFKLKMNFSGRFEGRKEDYLNFLSTYQTRFWFKEHQWFVRCAECLIDTHSCITLYTLPYCFDRIDLKHVSWSISTCPNEPDYWLDVQMKVRCLDSCNQQLPSLTHITCQLAFKNELCLRTQKSTITISFSNEIFSQIQVFLDHSLHYYSLAMFTESIHPKFCQLTSKSIRQLKFLTHRSGSSSTYYFTELDCKILANSLLGQQCEVLSIPIRNEQFLLFIFEKMSKLRSLNVEFDECQSSLDEERVLWLQNHLPSSIQISIVSTINI